MSDAQLQKELLTLEEAKMEMLNKTFGEDKAKKVESIREKLAKSVFEARKNQLEAQKATYAERKELVKTVENVRISRNWGILVEKLTWRDALQFWSLTLQKSSIAQDRQSSLTIRS